MVIWSESAKADLRAIHDYIAHDSRHYAKKVAQDIREKAHSLGELPRSGRKVPELDNEQVREFALYSYRVIYEIKAHDVFVLALVHKRRDLKAGDIATGV